MSGTITLHATVPWCGVHAPAQEYDDKTSRATWTWTAHRASRATKCTSHLLEILVLALLKLVMQVAKCVP